MVTPGGGSKRKDAAAAELRDRMSSISQRGYGEPWRAGLEAALWTLLRRGGGTFGRTVVTPAEVGILRALSASCGGWIAPESPDTDPILVPRAEWERRVQAAAERQ